MAENIQNQMAFSLFATSLLNEVVSNNLNKLSKQSLQEREHVSTVFYTYMNQEKPTDLNRLNEVVKNLYACDYKYLSLIMGVDCNDHGLSLILMRVYDRWKFAAVANGISGEDKRVLNFYDELLNEAHQKGDAYMLVLVLWQSLFHLNLITKVCDLVDLKAIGEE